MQLEDQRQLALDRDGSCRSVRLGRLALALAVHLVGERDLRIIGVRDLHVGPRQAKNLRDTRAGQRRELEQRPPRLACCGDGLL